VAGHGVAPTPPVKNLEPLVKAAKGNATSAKNSLAELIHAIEPAKRVLDKATTARKTLEDQIMDAQPADSDMGKIWGELRAAKKNYQDAVKSLQECDNIKDYKAKVHALLMLEYKGDRWHSDTRLAWDALRREYFAMPEVVNVETASKEVWEKEKRYILPAAKLLEADSKWVNADNEVNAKQAALDELERQLAAAKMAVKQAKAAARRAAAAGQ
jgi:chromosome segregation ATPase